jgi:hypothetical protein
MNQQLWWYVARSGGIVAWALLGASVLWGLALSTKVLHGKPRPNWILDLHRFLGGLALIFTGVHVVALVLDSYVHFGLTEILVPLASAWHPVAVAWGVIGLYLLLAVELTSLAKRISKRTWRMTHPRLPTLSPRCTPDGGLIVGAAALGDRGPPSRVSVRAGAAGGSKPCAPCRWHGATTVLSGSQVVREDSSMNSELQPTARKRRPHPATSRRRPSPASASRSSPAQAAQPATPRRRQRRRPTWCRLQRRPPHRSDSDPQQRPRHPQRSPTLDESS